MCNRNKYEISYSSVKNLRCDKPTLSLVISESKLKPSKVWPMSRFACIMKEADLNSCTYCIAQMMQEPFQNFPMATIAVESSIRDEFVERLRSQFRQLDPNVASHPNFERSLNVLASTGIKCIMADEVNAPPFASPVLVENTTQRAFGSGNSGVVTLHTFDTIKEAADIFQNEMPPFVAVHLFDEGIASVYSLAARINCIQFYVNTMEVSLLPIIEFYANRKSHAMFINGYHFETIELEGKWKIIVFPYIASLRLACCCIPGHCHCNMTDMNCCE